MIFVYEDEGYRSLVPLVEFRPMFDLLCGRETLLQKTRKLYPEAAIGLVVRPELAPLVRELYPNYSVNERWPGGPALFLSARAVFHERVSPEGPDELLVCRGETVGLRITSASFIVHRSLARFRALHLPEHQVNASVLRYPWDLVSLNETELARHEQTRRHGDTETRRSPRLRVSASPRQPFSLLGPAQHLFIASDASVEAEATLDVRSGAITIAPRAQVRAGSIVAGPCHIGPGTIIDGALIRPGCSFGPNCRIGGEVEASVFLGHANKHHEGFIGHAAVGEWVNLGALTTNSDLRNDYGEVKVMLNGKEINTGLRKAGCFIGDHAKTAIGTLLNTGAVLGIFANWFEPGLSPKDVPAFAWGKRGHWRLPDALQTARTVMSRRGVVMSPAYEKLIRRYYDRTKKSGPE
jgi:UDP-N-acetylglucosamine diphosphorylase/glucosamine-1-phosphate N-acetyltransferase